MSDERLDDASWKSFTAKHKIKEKEGALQKALTALASTPEAKAEERLAILAKITKEAENLKKIFKSERLVMECLKDITLGVEAEQAQITKLLEKSREEKPEPETKSAEKKPDADTEPKDSKPKDEKPKATGKPVDMAKVKPLVLAGLSAVKSKKPADAQLGFMAAICTSESRVLIAAQVGSAHKTLLTQMLAGQGTAKFFQGECRWEEGMYTFVLDTVPGGLSKKLQAALLSETGGTHRVRVRSFDGKTVADSETEKDADLAGDEAGQKKTPANTGDADAAKAAQAQWKKIKAELTPAIKTAMAGASATKAEVAKLLPAALAAEKAGDFAKAIEIFEQLRLLLSASGQTSAQTAPTKTLADFNQRVQAIKPNLTRVLEGKLGDVAAVRAELAIAQGHAKKGDFTLAIETLDAVEKRLTAILESGATTAPTTGTETEDDSVPDLEIKEDDESEEAANELQEIAWESESARLEPKLSYVLREGWGDGDKMRATFAFAQGKAESRDFTAALQSLGTLEALLDAAIQQGSGIDLSEPTPPPAERMYQAAYDDARASIQDALALTGGSPQLTELVKKVGALDASAQKLAADGSYTDALHELATLRAAVTAALERKTTEDREREELRGAYNLALFELNVDFRAALALGSTYEPVAKLNAEMEALFNEALQLAKESKYAEGKEKILAAQAKAREALAAAANAPKPVEPTAQEKYDAAAKSMQALIDSALLIDKGSPNLLSMKKGLLKATSERDKHVQAGSYADALQQLEFAHGIASRLLELKKEEEIEALSQKRFEDLLSAHAKDFKTDRTIVCPTPETEELRGLLVRDIDGIENAATQLRYATGFKLIEEAVKKHTALHKLLADEKKSQAKLKKPFDDAYGPIATRVVKAMKATSSDPEVAKKIEEFKVPYIAVGNFANAGFFTQAEKIMPTLKAALEAYEKAEADHQALLKKQKRAYDKEINPYRDRINLALKYEEAPSLAKERKEFSAARTAMRKAAKAGDHVKALELAPEAILKFNAYDNAYRAFKAQREKERKEYLDLWTPVEARHLAATQGRISGVKLIALSKDFNTAHKAMQKAESDLKYTDASKLFPKYLETLEALEKALAAQVKNKSEYLSKLEGCEARVAQTEKFGAVNSQIDAQKLAFQSAFKDAKDTAKLSDYPSANSKLDDAIVKLDALLKAKQDDADAKSEAFKQKREDAVNGRSAELGAIGRGIKGPDHVLDEIESAQEDTKALGKSKGLDALMTEARIVQKEYKVLLKKLRVLDGSGIDRFIKNVDSALKNIAPFQKDHPATGSKDDKAKHAQAEALRESYVEMRAGIFPCRAALMYLEDKLGYTDDDSCAEAAAYLQKIIASKALVQLRFGAQVKLRELIKRLLAAARTPDRKREIGDLIGGPFGASIQRQAEKPLLKDTLDSSNIEDDLWDFEVVDPRCAGLTDQARVLSSRLFDDTGAFESAALIYQDPEELAKSFGSGPHAKQMVRALKTLRDRPELQELIESIPAPDPGNPMTDMIRATLGLSPDTVVTESHARQAVVSSYLAELRQAQVGSCFGTSIAIHLHDNKPELMFADMKALCATGKLVRKVRGEDVEIPVHRDMSDGILKEPLTFSKADGKMIESSNATFPPEDLQDVPPLDKIVGQMGLINPATDVAAAVAKTRLFKSLDAALLKIPSDKRAAVRRAAIRKIETDGISTDAAIPDLVRDMIDAEGGIPGSARDEAATAASNFLGEARYELPTDEIMRALALKASGLTITELSLFEERAELSVKVQALQGHAATPEDKKLLDDLSKLDAKLKGKGPAYAKYLDKVSAAENGFCAQQENRLLRAWEYTVSSMSERGIATQYSDKMNEASIKAMGSMADTVFEELKNEKKSKTPLGPEATPIQQQQAKALSKTSGSDLDKISKKLQAKFQELLKLTLKAGYDSGVEDQDISSDGKSTEGAFFLFDTQGISDPTKWIKIDNQKKYGDVMGGLVLLAWQELYGNEKDETLAHASRAAAEKLSKAARSQTFTNKAKGKSESITGDEKQSPWQHITGSDERLVMDTYFGTEFGKNNKESPNFYPKDSEELLTTMVTRMQQSWAKISEDVLADPESASIMMGNNCHAFALKPGLFKSAMTEGKTPEEWTKEVIAKETAKNNDINATKLTAGLLDTMLRKTLGDYYSDDAVRNDLIGRLPSNPKVSDFDKALQEHAQNYAYPADEVDELEEKYATKGAEVIVNCVLPPLEGTAIGKAIDDIMDDLGKPAAIARENFKASVMSACGAKADMAKIEKAVKGALAARTLTDPTDDRKMYASLQKQVKPRGVVFADTNWGGGDHKIMLSMVVNPVNGELETWEMNEDGTGAEKKEQDDWAQGRWNIDSAPETHGGV